MAKLDLPYFSTYFDRHGKERARYRRGHYTRQIKARPIGGEDFLAEYWMIHNGYKEPAVRRDDTFDALCAAYYAAPAFTKRTADTRAEYRRHIEDARCGPEDDPGGWGQLKATSISKRAILAWRDDRADRPHTANAGVEVLRTLFNWAIEYDWPIKENPAIGIRPLVEPDTDGWEPWPKWALKRWAEESRGVARYAFFLALFTGQRRADVLSFPWERRRRGSIQVEQMKSANTAKRVRLLIPEHPLLTAEMDRLKAEQLARYRRRLAKGQKIADRSLIIQKLTGEPYTEDGFGTIWNREQHRLGIHFPFHGLRKNAAIALLEAGCTKDQAKAITGHQTDDMLDHYTKRVNQRKLAQAAINMLTSACFFEEEEDGSATVP